MYVLKHRSFIGVEVSEHGRVVAGSLLAGARSAGCAGDAVGGPLFVPFTAGLAQPPVFPIAVRKHVVGLDVVVGWVPGRRERGVAGGKVIDARYEHFPGAVRAAAALRATRGSGRPRMVAGTASPVAPGVTADELPRGCIAAVTYDVPFLGDFGPLRGEVVDTGDDDGLGAGGTPRTLRAPLHA